MRTLGVTLAALLATSLTSTAAADEFVTVGVKLNRVMAPKSITAAAQECAKDPLCKQVVSKAGELLLGIPPKAISVALALIPQAHRAGEEGWYTFTLPNGYVYCRSEIETVSVSPASGDRASVMGASSIDNGVTVYTWTPRQGVGGGRSWVEANYTLVGVRADVAEKHRQAGICKQPGRVLVSCRGAKGINKGMPACGSVRD